jgi:hypothetical protein
VISKFLKKTLDIKNNRDLKLLERSLSLSLKIEVPVQTFTPATLGKKNFDPNLIFQIAEEEKVDLEV